MEYFSTSIVVFWIFACIFWLATLVFIAMDKEAKEDYHQRWFWFIMAMPIGPIILLPYWFWGRERPISKEAKNVPTKKLPQKK